MMEDVANSHAYIEILERRILWLEKRIKKRLDDGLDASLDARELNALRWSVGILHEWSANVRDEV